MTRGLYIAGTGMMLQRRRMETITNNIANSDTTGYKKEHFLSHSFDEVLLSRMNDHNQYWPYRDVGPLNLGTQVDHLFIDFAQGNLEGTERPTDFALIGENNFFIVQTADGERYTRSGHFYIDTEGYLIDGDNNRLLGTNGAIYVGGLDFYVNTSGQVYTEDGYVNTIRVASFEDPTTLRRQGGNLYFATVAPQGETAPYAIAQGFLESSNVDIGREMVDMLAMYRTYETNQRMLTMIDETTARAVNDIGRLR